MFKKMNDFIIRFEYELKYFSSVILALFLGALLALVLTGCGSLTKSSRHDVVASGEIIVTQRVTIDASVCDVFQAAEEKAACVQALLDALSKGGDAQGASGAPEGEE